MAIGRIVRAIAGFYYVEPLNGNSQPVECSVRGKLKLGSESLLVGDKVEYINNGQAVITAILPRESVLNVRISPI